MCISLNFSMDGLGLQTCDAILNETSYHKHFTQLEVCQEFDAKDEAPLSLSGALHFLHLCVSRQCLPRGPHTKRYCM